MGWNSPRPSAPHQHRHLACGASSKYFWTLFLSLSCDDFHKEVEELKVALRAAVEGRCQVEGARDALEQHYQEKLQVWLWTPMFCYLMCFLRCCKAKKRAPKKKLRLWAPSVQSGRCHAEPICIKSMIASLERVRSFLRTNFASDFCPICHGEGISCFVMLVFPSNVTCPACRNLILHVSLGLHLFRIFFKYNFNYVANCFPNAFWIVRS